MIIGIAGAAGSGKDTVAGFISQYAKAISIAQADPMKRFARDVFGFTEQQLWGPSECRNAPDPLYDHTEHWHNAEARCARFAFDWIDEVLPGLSIEKKDRAYGALVKWFTELSKFHFDNDRQLTPRYVLQTIGTEWGRQFSGDMWNAVARRTARALLGGGHGYHKLDGLYVTNAPSADPEFVLITDVRFRNEVVGIHEVGGIVINITSPAEDNAAVEKAGVAGHKSEAELKGIPQHWFDYIITNDKARGLLALENRVHTFVNSLKSSPPRFSTAFDGPEYESYETRSERIAVACAKRTNPNFTCDVP